jgi:hypothetical protein
VAALLAELGYPGGSAGQAGQGRTRIDIDPGQLVWVFLARESSGRCVLTKQVVADPSR